MMSDMMLEDKDYEDMQFVPCNLELVTLYTYRDYFLL